MYLILLSLLGVILVFINTSSYGPGISSDGMEYISAADNLLRGQGFTNFHGGVYILWPPLYPLILAGLRLLTGLDVIVAGWILNAVTFGSIVYLAGVLFKICFPDGLAWPALGAFITLFSLSYLSLASNIASDSLFIVMVLAFFIACQRYLTNSGRAALAMMILLATLAPLLRFLGVCMMAAGALAVLVQQRRQPVKAIGLAALFGLGTSLPTLAWVIGRNYLHYGSLTGPRHFQDAYPLLNIAYCARMILRWFVPLNILNRLPLWLIPALLLAVLLLLAPRRYWASFFQKLRGPAFWPMLAFSALYLVIIILTTITFDHTHPYDDRFQAVLFTPVLILAFAMLQDLVIAPLRGRGLQIAGAMASGLVLLWSAYPVYVLWKYVGASLQEGEAVYNLYNARSFQASPVIQFLERHPLEAGAPVYSNDPEAVYLFARQNIEYSPRVAESARTDPAYLEEHYPSWPPEGVAYLVWFITPGDRRNFFTPEDLSGIADLEPLRVNEKAGGVYRVYSRAK